MLVEKQVAHSREWEQCVRLCCTLDRERVFLTVDDKKGVRLHGTFERGDAPAMDMLGLAGRGPAIQAYARSQTSKIRPTTRDGTFHFDMLDATVRFTHISTEVPDDTPWDIGLGWDDARGKWYRVEEIGTRHVHMYKTVYSLGLEILGLNRFYESKHHNRDDSVEGGWSLTVPLTRSNGTMPGRILSVPPQAMQAMAFSESLLAQGDYSGYVDGTYDAWPRGAGETPAEIDRYDDTRERDAHITSWDTPTHSLYHTLGLKRNATPLEIKDAFHAMARKMHPDKGGDRDAFNEVKRASRILRDDDLKRDYDAKGDWVRFGGGPTASPQFDCMMANPYVV